MKKMSETIVFFGSGPVAAASLALLAQSFNIEAVVTKPRPLNHHGNVPVLDMSHHLNIPIIEVIDRKGLVVKLMHTKLSSRVAVLIDFGIIVPKEVVEAFPLGIVNSHFSLLPEWRGADPITFAILSGQKRTGVSLMLLVEKMDEGPLIAQGNYDIEENETTPTLTDHLTQLSYALLREVLPSYVTGAVLPVPQDISAAASAGSLHVSYSRKLTKEDGVLNWDKTAEVLEREIRAYQGWPKSRSVLRGIEVVITKAHVMASTLAPGEILATNKTLAVGTKHNALAIDALTPVGKKEMSVVAFLAGYGAAFRDKS